MDSQTYKKVIKLIIIANLIFFALSNYNMMIKSIGYIVGMLTPFILGSCIAFILNIPMKFIESKLSIVVKNKGLARGLSILATIMIFFAGIVVVISIIIPEIIASVNEVSVKLPDLLENLMKFLDKQGISIKQVVDQYTSDDFDLTKMDLGQVLSQISLMRTSSTLMSIFSATSSVFSTLLNIFLGLIFAIYILAGKEQLSEKSQALVKKIFKSGKSDKVLAFGNLVNKIFTGFVSGQGTEALILGMMFFVTMNIFQIPKVLSSSAIIGVFSLIPIFGAFIGYAFSAITILIISPIKALWFTLLFLLLQQIEGNLIYPKVVGKSVGLPGMWVLFAVTVGGSLAGINGIIIGVPTASVIYTLVNEYIQQDDQ